jgi:hypothetical protein
MPAVPGGGVGGLPTAGKCPDMAKVDEIEAFDFGKEFSLKADVAAKIKAGVGAAVEMKALSDKIEADLTAACSTLAKDLGDTGSYSNAQDACKAAGKAVNDAKVKLGASAKISMEPSEPVCAADVKVYGDCAAKCDVNVKPGEAEVKCEPGKLQGSCSGKCEGECDTSAAAACSGECSGSCDAEIKGACSGNCQGKCDGKATPAGSGAACSGVCEGKCSGNVKATCKGKCGGSCKLSAKASCTGTCTGSCDVKMEAPKCAGKFEPPQMSAECKAKCDAGIQAKAECTAPRLVIRITGATDAKLAATLQANLEKDLPGVIKIAEGTGKRAGELAGSVKTVITGVQGVVQTAGDPMAVGKLSACVGAPFTGALDAANKVQANVSVSVSVSASVQGGASGSASASGKAG